MNGNFMTFAVCLLNGWIVCVFVRHEECCFNVTAIGIFTFSIEDVFVQLDVVVIDGVVVRDRYHHWNIFCGQATGNGCAILWAETIRQHTNGGICCNPIASGKESNDNNICICMHLHENTMTELCGQMLAFKFMDRPNCPMLQNCSLGIIIKTANVVSGIDFSLFM